jgi:hypothetical protein
MVASMIWDEACVELVEVVCVLEKVISMLVMTMRELVGMWSLQQSRWI